MVRQSFALAAFGLAVSLSSAPGLARDPQDAAEGSRAQERLDRDSQRVAERAGEVAARHAEERARIDERAVRDPERAVEERAKLDADTAREEGRLTEEQAKVEEDFAEESEKEAEDAAEDLAEYAEAEDAAEESGSLGSSREIRDLGMAEGAEHDEAGFPVRRGEVVAMDVSPATFSALQAKGYRLIERHRLAGLDREIMRLAAPAGKSSLMARDQLRQIDPSAVVDLVHYYGLNLTAGSRGKRVRAKDGAAAHLAAHPAPHSGALTVGMIDTAVGRHAALSASRVVAWPAGNLTSAPLEHGTAVASLLAGEGSATIYSANIFRGPANRPFTSADVIAEALEWMIASNVGTVNMSLAGPRNAVLDRLIRDASARGYQVVAAAGNGGPTAPPAYPAAVPGVIAVTAVDGDMHIYRYANRGRYIAVAARGVDVVAARSAGGFASFDGTSFATPHVAGWIARCRARGATAPACRERLRTAARDLGPVGFDEVYGFGFIE